MTPREAEQQRVLDYAKSLEAMAPRDACGRQRPQAQQICYHAAVMLQRYAALLAQQTPPTPEKAQRTHNLIVAEANRLCDGLRERLLQGSIDPGWSDVVTLVSGLASTITGFAPVVTELAAENERLKGEKWQPIDTAPEATHVLVWLPDAGVFSALRTGRDWWLQRESQICYPSHWMPMPAAPAHLEAER